MDYKICTCCNLTFKATIENFNKNKKGKFGLAALCKSCNKKRIKKWYDSTSKEHHVEVSQKWIKKKLEKDPDYRRNKENEGYKSIIKRLKHCLKSAKSRAKERDLDFDLTIEYLLELNKKQNSCCQLTNISFDLNPPKYKSGHNPLSPSIDRIDSTKGYTKDNTRLICTAMNIALNQFGDEFFFEMIKNYLKTTKNIKI